MRIEDESESEPRSSTAPPTMGTVTTLSEIVQWRLRELSRVPVSRREAEGWEAPSTLPSSRRIPESAPSHQRGRFETCPYTG